MSEENENLVTEEVEKNTSENDEKLRWYVIHTYSGYENKVKANIEKIVENRNMYDLISELVIPLEEAIEITENSKGERKEKKVQRKIFPTYVFVKMIMNDDTWYVIRNTRGVTSFVGPGSKPVPLTDEEVKKMGIENFEISCDVSVGDAVVITEGSMANLNGVVKEVNLNKRTVVVTVEFFGRETPVELNFNQVKLMA